MFLQVSVCPLDGGVCPIASWDTSPWTDTPRQTPSPCAVHAGIQSIVQCMLGYGQQAGGTHPTGMHSCFRYNRFDLPNVIGNKNFRRSNSPITAAIDLTIAIARTNH